MSDLIKISVRALVEYAYRSGSIETGFRTATALTEGTKAHQKVQQTYGEQDQKEVFLQMEIPYGEMVFVLEGRCDGLLFDGNEITIDEIKSSGGDPHLIEENRYPVHWAQAYCYAYMYAKQEGLGQIRVQLSYVQVGTDEKQQYVRVLSLEELEAAVLEAVRRYAPYADMQLRNRRNRDLSIKELAFPYKAYREGQRKFAGAVYQTIAEERKLFANAPTGTGKTISTLFPSVKAIGEGLLQRIFYLTAKTLTRTAAEDAFALMNAKGLQMKVVTLTAKDKICFREEGLCSQESCEFAEGYYDRVNGAILDMLQHETQMNRTVIETYARKHKVCPFEFSLDAAYAADAVICDYNYIFDPKVFLKRMPEELKKQTVLLIDEAHNLVDRGREMFSAELTKAPFLQLRREFKERSPGVAGAAKAVNDYFIAFRKARGEQRSAVLKELPEELLPLLEAFVQHAERELAAPSGVGDSELLLDMFFTAQRFLRTAKYYDDKFVTLAELQKNDVRLKLMCLDPSLLLAHMGRGFRSHIYFSATLSPFSYYMDMLGGGEDDYTIAIPWPFRQEQLDVWIEPLSTRYKDREKSLEPIVGMLNRLLRDKPGNYLVFFPSYDYMREVAALFSSPYAEAVRHEESSVRPEASPPDKPPDATWDRDIAPNVTEPSGASLPQLEEEKEPGSGDPLQKQCRSQILRLAPDMDMLVQEPFMSEEMRESFLSAFQEDSPRTLIGFAVMGGIFSEGIDLRGERLTGVVVVGVGLPQIGPERDRIKEHFDLEGRSGFDYAYVFPGMNKVMQAGGRLIRTENDYGTLVLVDDRFLQKRYQALLPPEWRHFTVHY
ncbi:ATP-dependent DNA helicase [Paenibacillus lutrae]|uniref:ATP-dependent DNA helicase n=1 Tax=Paenibacillus lutrae TaxID=2078573 RepID=A0A7X3FKX1_9BACL|nr:ATP-dependent DNA helicase [Paenibacillus lutrae]MVP01636.1 ATP-dependent DNA helicase [Paenibacillus lutrae]